MIQSKVWENVRELFIDIDKSDLSWIHSKLSNHDHVLIRNLIQEGYFDMKNQFIWRYEEEPTGTLGTKKALFSRLRKNKLILEDITVF